MNNFLVEHKLFIQARQEIIYSYFVQPQKLSQWLGRSANLDPKYNGGLRINMNQNDFVQGNYRILEPYSRICFTWGWDGSESHPPGSSIVEIILDPHDNGTWLTLTHAAIPDEELDCHNQGWEQNLFRLKNLLQEGVAYG
ncbi:SRPBCC family protein [Paenibacillus mendelii]|uniref:SRPBCC domain-containing protein n=1 Tax=Paenibacillus mendelii TaxID=206163 RepID=A0ABV6JK75_9BACL|nr:SRPBCC domain-containing protein [Paenibacillus mendelii]MCQ6559895.1 SRPBCC domain-containing protein [Paenibacillus mendelii]